MFFFPFSKHDHVLTLPYLRKAMPYDRKSINEVKKLCTTHLPLLPYLPPACPSVVPLVPVQVLHGSCRKHGRHVGWSCCTLTSAVGGQTCRFVFSSSLKQKVFKPTAISPRVWCPVELHGRFLLGKCSLRSSHSSRSHSLFFPGRRVAALQLVQCTSNLAC